MISDPPTITIPLQTDENGTIHVRNSRVTLDTLIARYQQGKSPEAIHEGFPTISLDYIYAIIAYYLANRNELDIYLQQRKADAERIRQEIEANYTPEHKAFTEKLRKLAQEKRQQTGN